MPPRFQALLNRPTPILAWAVAFVLAGGWMATQVPLEWVPTVELPEVHIAASWPGHSPRAVERYVTAPIERSVQNVDGTMGIESVSEAGRATIILQVAEDTELGSYVARVNERLALLKGVLPDRIVPRLSKRVPEVLRDQQGFMTLQLVGAETPGQLRRRADEQVAPVLHSLSGVGDVVVRGGTEHEIRVILNPDRLAAHDIQASAVRDRLASATQSTVHGRLRARGNAALLLSPAESDVDALQRLVVSPSGRLPLIRLRDVGTLEHRTAPRRTISRIDGDPVVTLTLDRAPGASMLAVSDAVRARLAALQETLPDETRLRVADDKTEDVRNQLHNLTWRGGLGFVLVVLVLVVMLRSLRAVGVVLFSVALALAVALALMVPLDLTLNLLTLAGLVLVFGLLVDNAVVMTEQVLWQRKRLRASIHSDVSQHRAASRDAFRAVGLPLVGGTLTTMAVMVPLVYLSGDLRALFLPFGILTALTLGASLVSAGILVPVLARWLPLPQSPSRMPRVLRHGVERPFAWGTRFPKTTGLLLVLLLGVPLWAVPHTLTPAEGDPWPVPVQRWASLYNATVGSETIQDARTWLEPMLGGVLRPFVRQTNFGAAYRFRTPPEAFVRLGFPPGTPTQRADSLLQRFEQTALASASVRRTIARITERRASLRVQFTNPSMQTAEPYVVRQRLIQEAVLLAGIDASVGGLLPQGYSSRSGMGVSGYTVVAYGANYDDLADLCDRFARTLKERSRRVAGVNTNAGRFGRQQPRSVLRFRYGAAKQAQAGVSPRRLTASLQPVLATRFPDLYADVDGRTQTPIRIVVSGADTLDVRTLADRPLRLDDSTFVKLKSVASSYIDEIPPRIVRENQQYKRYIHIDYRGPHRMGDAFVQKALDGFAAPPGYRIEREQLGFLRDADSRTTFGWVVLATLMLVFLVTAAVFESWRLPVVVLLSVPTAAIGVAIGFLWANIAFAEGAFIGTVLLVGIAANDSILLVDRFRQLRVHRPRGKAAPLARLAVRHRLRPMWTTTLSTCVALLPLMVVPQEGDFWLGLAVTVTGGLLSATLLAPLASVALLAQVAPRASAHP